MDASRKWIGAFLEKEATGSTLVDKTVSERERMEIRHLCSPVSFITMPTEEDSVSGPANHIVYTVLDEHRILRLVPGTPQPPESPEVPAVEVHIFPVLVKRGTTSDGPWSSAIAVAVSDAGYAFGQLGPLYDFTLPLADRLSLDSTVREALRGLNSKDTRFDEECLDHCLGPWSTINAVLMGKMDDFYADMYEEFGNTTREEDV
jgi:hypothetical protein